MTGAQGLYSRPVAAQQCFTLPLGIFSRLFLETEFFVAALLRLSLTFSYRQTEPVLCHLQLGLQCLVLAMLLLMLQAPPAVQFLVLGLQPSNRHLVVVRLQESNSRLILGSISSSMLTLRVVH